MNDHTSKAECRCSRPLTDAAAICRVCTEGLVSNLLSLAGLVDDLALARTRQVRFGTSPVRVAREGVPFDERASRVLVKVRRHVGAWAGFYEIPGTQVSSVLERMADTPTIATIRMGAEAPTLCTQLEDLIIEVEKVIDRPQVRKFVGRCDCGSDLYAWPWESDTACSSCGLIYTVSELLNYWLRQTRDLLMSAEDCATALGMAGTPITPEQIRRWARAGRLLPRATASRGSNLYAVSEVIESIQHTGYVFKPHGA